MTEIVALLHTIAPLLEKNDFTPIEPGHVYHTDSERTNHDAGHVALDEERRQLSHHPVAVSYPLALERDPLVVFPQAVFANCR